MKRVLACIMAISILPIFHTYAFTDTQNPYITLLYDLGVVCGNGNGEFKPNDSVSRAEVAKMACIMLDLSESSGGSLFSDISQDFWGVGYTNATAICGIFTGYPDGTFGPENGITYAEAITIALRMLGYNSSNIKGVYPASYLNKAKELGLIDNLQFDPDDYINRQAIAYILAKCMATDGADGKSLADSFDCTLSNECTIMADYQASSTKLLTSIGTYTYYGDKDIYQNMCAKLLLDKDDKVKGIIPLGKDFASTDTKITGILNNVSPSRAYATTLTVNGTDYSVSSDILRTALQTIELDSIITLVLNENGEAVVAYESKSLGDTYGIANVTGNELTCVNKEEKRIISMQNSYKVIFDGLDTTFSAIKDKIEEGMSITVFYENGEFDYCIIEECELDGPRLVTSNGENPFGTGKVFIRDGKSAQSTELKANDVCYYSESLDTIYAYCDSVIGVYEKAMPNKQNPSSVKVSGEEYKIETSTAASSFAGIDYNSYIELLLGREGDVAFVTTTGKSVSASNYGVCIRCEKKTVNGVQDFYITCIGATGEEQSFKCKTDRSDLVGKAIKYVFDGEYLTPTILSNNSVSGAIDKNAYSIGGKYLSSDCKIIDVAYVYRDEEASAVKIELSDISKTSLTKDEILGSATGSDGDIVFIALNNITYRACKLGIMNSRNLSSVSSYTITYDGDKKSYTSTISQSIGVGKVVAFIEDGGSITYLKPLTVAIDNSAPLSFSAQRVRTNKDTVQLTANCEFYVKTADSKYLKTTAKDLTDSDIKSISVYTDARPQDGGRGIFVIATLK